MKRKEEGRSMSNRKFTVHFTGNLDVSVEVVIEEDGKLGFGDLIDQVIERAYNERPTSLCSSCSGWGRPFSITLSDDMEVDSVFDEDGQEIY